MSEQSGLSKVLDSIGRLKVGEINRTILAGLAFIGDRRRAMHPAVPCVRCVAVTFGAGFACWGYLGKELRKFGMAVPITAEYRLKRPV